MLFPSLKQTQSPSDCRIHAIVPGYLVTWKGKKDKLGRSVSEVEPVTDEADRQYIEATLRDTQTIFKPNIEFW